MVVAAPALEAYALTKGRRAVNGEMHIWHSPDIVVGLGQLVAVQGECPADLQLLLGLLSTLVEPSGGVLRIGGEEAEDMPRRGQARLRARRVGLLFREPKLIPSLSVWENVALPQQSLHAPHAQAKDRARAVLERLGQAVLLRKDVTQLTPTEGQYVALARALVNHPTILLADEPTAGLSPDEAHRFLTLLRQVGQEEQVAILVGTSSVQVAAYAERTIQLPTASELLPTSPEDTRADDFFSELYDADVAPFVRPLAPLIDLVLKPLAYTAAVAVMIVFLTFFGLNMAGLGGPAVGRGIAQTGSYSIGQSATYLRDLLRGDLGNYRAESSLYYWSRQSEKPIIDGVRSTLDKSVVLLLIAMALGALIGVPLGIVGALARHRRFSLLFIVVATIGVSTPSFFLALLLQILEINLYRWTHVTLLPVGGFGWDSHIVLPALVLAARPIAQVARVSSVALSEVLDADYVRTAWAKGLNARLVLARHALRNAGVPILSALGASLQFSLSSLPIVEALFNWPGMGDLLLRAIKVGETRLAATLTLVLGVLFVLVHVILDWAYRWVDPRLRGEKAALGVERTWWAMFQKGWAGLRQMPDRLDSLLPWVHKGGVEPLPPLPVLNGSATRSLEAQKQRDAKIRQERRRAWVQSTMGSPSFMLGGLILLALLGMVVLGQRVAPQNPYNPTTSMTINGQLQTPPFRPSAIFPLGTDTLGRDVWTQLLYGARRTLSLAFFAVLARILIGLVLGSLSGWFSGSLLDRALSSFAQVMAAFPTLLLAMVLIYALGIRQGVWVFALALSLVGWGESAQFVRGQVMRIREQDYVEGALAVGLGDIELLARHVLPNLVPSLVVLACLEMGGVLMLLGELGFLGVFIGGGWTTRGVGDAVVAVFNVPEWGAMVAGSWRSFRSQPWMTFYPALAFTVAIMGFNLFGEGLRRLTERLTLSMHRILNRYTVGAALGIGALSILASEITGGWAQFGPSSRKFDAARAMSDVQALAALEMQGRGVEGLGLQAAADYIAQQFAALDLQPAGVEEAGKLTYFAPTRFDYRELVGAPTLDLRDSAGQSLGPLVYRRDYAELPGQVPGGNADLRSLEVLYLSMLPDAQNWPSNMGVDPSEMWGKALLTTGSDLPPVFYFMYVRPSAVLVIADDEKMLGRRELVSQLSSGDPFHATPYLLISPKLADAILKQGGSSLEEVTERNKALREGEGYLLHTGVTADLNIRVSDIQKATPSYVQAFTPGQDETLDSEMVLLLAYYDGQGTDFGGTPYPGANMNASGVATMLEVARVLKETDYKPNRTILFVAWAGAELGESPDFVDMLSARTGFIEAYRLAAVIELNGVGAGTSNTLLIDEYTSGRLTEVLQEAARRSKVKLSTSGVGAWWPYGNLYPSPDKKVPYVSLTWDGGDPLAHTPADTAEHVEPDRLRSVGCVVALATMYLAHEKQY